MAAVGDAVIDDQLADDIVRIDWPVSDHLGNVAAAAVAVRAVGRHRPVIALMPGPPARLIRDQIGGARLEQGSAGDRRERRLTAQESDRLVDHLNTLFGFDVGARAGIMKQLGVEAWCTMRKVQVKSTLENMQDALEGEEHEIEKTYPMVLEDARRRKNHAVIGTFTRAMEAEKAHARLYGEAVALLESGRMDSWIEVAREYYVCPECGYTAETLKRDESCPVCRCSQERFEAVE